MATYSTNLALTLQTTGENPGTWGDVTNTNLGTLLEQAVSGYTTQAITDGADTVITIPNGATGVARNMTIEMTGALTASRNMLVPANRKLYFIYNNTTGSQSVTVKVSGQTGVSVPNGKRMMLVSNGTDIVEAATYFTTFGTGSINSTPIGNTTASSGAFTTLSASSTVSGTGFSNYFAVPPPLGSTSPNTAAFTTITASSTVTLSPPNANVVLSPTGTGTVTVSPATAGTLNNVSIGATTASTGAFTTLSASSTVSGTGFTNYLASPAAIGTTTPAGARFTFAHTVPVAVTFSATAMAIDCALSNVFTTTFTANVTTAPTLSNLKDGQSINWFITQDATGSRTMTWPTSFKWPGGTAGVLSTTANAVDLVVATYRSATGFWYATLSKAFA